MCVVTNSNKLALWSDNSIKKKKYYERLLVGEVGVNGAMLEPRYGNCVINFVFLLPSETGIGLIDWIRPIYSV